MRKQFEVVYSVNGNVIVALYPTYDEALYRAELSCVGAAEGVKIYALGQGKAKTVRLATVTFERHTNLVRVHEEYVIC